MVRSLLHLLDGAASQRIYLFILKTLGLPHSLSYLRGDITTSAYGYGKFCHEPQIVPLALRGYDPILRAYPSLCTNGGGHQV